jgi:hypothetical protein
MDTVLLAICFVAMGILVLAWAMLPHAAPATTPTKVISVARQSPGAVGTLPQFALQRDPS